ncbi:hypothetical protein ACFPYJ_02575 [Paenibacillus solisilvae]|uniref:Uncharacterized protein n=1 Tax=Paenibacillus solisilvae TaxID=2486751 RepID=A0ABW0VRV3_9BACL
MSIKKTAMKEPQFDDEDNRELSPDIVLIRAPIWNKNSAPPDRSNWVREPQGQKPSPSQGRQSSEKN